MKRVACLLGMLALAIGTAFATPISYSDAWDVRKGSTLIWTSGVSGSDLDAMAMFGATTATGVTTFQSGQPAGFVHWIEWSTPVPVTVHNFNLFGNVSSFSLYAGGQIIFSGEMPAGASELTGSVTSLIRSDVFRAEFVQAGSLAPAVSQLDGIANPEPAGFALALAGLGVLAGVKIARRRQPRT